MVEGWGLAEKRGALAAYLRGRYACSAARAPRPIPGLRLHLADIADEFLDLLRGEFVLVDLHALLAGLVLDPVGRRLDHVGVLHFRLHLGVGVIAHVQFAAGLGLALAVGTVALRTVIFPVLRDGSGDENRRDNERRAEKADGL